MNRNARLRWLAVVVVVLGVILLAACGGQTSDTGGGEALDGEALVADRCTQCHNLDKATSLAQDEAGWRQTVEDMVQKGAELNAEEQEAVIAYLAEAYGP